MDESQRRAHEQNRRSWNAVTPAHNSHKVRQAEFLAGGGSTLFPEELELLGELQGRELVHLQCNCGQDSLSLVHHGARVTGVDISDEAIAFAEQLSNDSGLDAKFVRSDLFDWFDESAPREHFDLAFSSYGTIGWLSDISRWARGVAACLRPGGKLVLLEFHPMIWSFGADGRVIEPYFIEEPLEESGVNDYVGATGSTLSPSGWAEGIKDFANPEKNVSYQWTVAQIVQSLADAGLRIQSMREYPYANGCVVFPDMQALPGRRFRMPPGVPDMPLMLGIVASKD